VIIDLEDPAEMAKAIRIGYIWSAPQSAIVRACELLADGSLPMPDDVPPEWRAYIESLRPAAPTKPAPVKAAKPSPAKPADPDPAHDPAPWTSIERTRAHAAYELELERRNTAALAA
jgi:hypothetical protein